MEYEEQQGGIVQRIKDSPRTVSTIIIILVIAAAIFAFSDREEQPTATPTTTGEEEMTTEPTEEGVETEEGDVLEETGEETPTETAETSIEELPDATEDEGAFTEVTQSGEGITHLSRRAMLRELERSSLDFEVTGEHKVFIEDYIQNRIGTESLEIGEIRRVEKDLIREAIDASRNLSGAQLENLKQFSRRVAAYQ